MKEIEKASLLLMVVLTAIYASAVMYKVGYAYGKSYALEYSSAKHPTQYGISTHYLAEKLETEPEEWYTPDELGIILVESKVTEGCYNIFIAREHEEKALAWMRDGEFAPYALKYEDEYYQILSLWVTAGIGELQWEIPIGVALVAGWVFTGVLIIRERKAR